MNSPQNPPDEIEPAQNDLDWRFNGTPDDEINLFDILAFLVRNRSLILAITVVSTLLSAGYALSITPMYKATIGFLMPQEVLLPEKLFTKKTIELHKTIKDIKLSLYQNFLMTIQSYNFQRKVFETLCANINETLYPC